MFLFQGLDCCKVGGVAGTSSKRGQPAVDFPIGAKENTLSASAPGDFTEDWSEEKRRRISNEDATESGVRI